jgi:aminoglycoside phosphotransferase (APT) family kinase protein
MSVVPADPPSRAQVEAFLGDHHGRPVADLTPLTDGFWSSAFGYRVGDDELVARFGQVRQGFEADRAAMAHHSADLPVPEVLAVGEAFGGAFAVSRRHHGRFLEDVAPDEVERARPMLARLLGALRDAPRRPGADVEPDPSWRRWLVATLEEDEQLPSAGWRAALAADPSADRLFRALQARVAELAEACPERRDLVHGDLLHRNVLVREDASKVEAVFSWKCAVRGDHLFDTAWCTFWGETFHPGIAALDAWSLMRDEAGDAAALRHHCYELHIGASHLGWYAWTKDPASLRIVEAHTAMLLERGPRP